MLDNPVTANVMSSAGVAPPSVPPAIVITSPTSYPVPPTLTATYVIPPLAFVTTLNFAPDPSNSTVESTPVYV